MSDYKNIFGAAEASKKGTLNINDFPSLGGETNVKANASVNVQAQQQQPPPNVQ